MTSLTKLVLETKLIIIIIIIITIIIFIIIIIIIIIIIVIIIIYYPVRKNLNLEFRLDKILCFRLGHYPSTNS